MTLINPIRFLPAVAKKHKTPYSHLPGYDDILIVLGNNMRYLRDKSGLTQLDLGDLIGCSLSTIHFIETGRRAPSFPTLTKIALEFGVSPSDLLQTDLDAMYHVSIDPVNVPGIEGLQYVASRIVHATLRESSRVKIKTIDVTINSLEGYGNSIALRSTPGEENRYFSGHQNRPAEWLAPNKSVTALYQNRELVGLIPCNRTRTPPIHLIDNITQGRTKLNNTRQNNTFENYRTNIQMHILHRLKELDKTEQWLAQKIGVDISTISHYIHCRRIPRFENLAAIFSVLGLPPAQPET